MYVCINYLNDTKHVVTRSISLKALESIDERLPAKTWVLREGLAVVHCELLTCHSVGIPQSGR